MDPEHTDPDAADRVAYVLHHPALRSAHQALKEVLPLLLLARGGDNHAVFEYIDQHGNPALLAAQTAAIIACDPALALASDEALAGLVLAANR